MHPATPDSRSKTARRAPAVCAGLWTLVLATVASGCVYRINIIQGNFLEPKTVDQLTIGMTRSQVRFLLGTPMVADDFDPNRWDYFYYFKDGKTRAVSKRHFIVYFADEKVARVEKPLGEFKPLPKPATPGA